VWHATSSRLAYGRSPTDSQYAPSEFFPVQGSHSQLGLPVLLEFDEPESARLIGRTILNDFHGPRPESLGSKPLPQGIFGFAERDVANKQSIQISPPENPKYDSLPRIEYRAFSEMLVGLNGKFGVHGGIQVPPIT
jgi:hypothetical protein